VRANFPQRHGSVFRSLAPFVLLHLLVSTTPHPNSCQPVALTLYIPMKNNSTLLYRALLVSALVGSILQSRAADPTAFDLIKEGNRLCRRTGKKQSSPNSLGKSVGSLTPIVWYVVFYDSTATLKAVEVKFAAGKMQDVKRPLRLLEPVTGGDTPLDREKLKVDSDEAIKTALKEQVLSNIKVTATQLKLEKVGEGVLERSGVGEAVWKIKLWALKLRDASRDADIGEVWVSAADGKVVKSDLRINHLD